KTKDAEPTQGQAENPSGAKASLRTCRRAEGLGTIRRSAGTRATRDLKDGKIVGRDGEGRETCASKPQSISSGADPLKRIWRRATRRATGAPPSCSLGLAP